MLHCLVLLLVFWMFSGCGINIVHPENPEIFLPNHSTHIRIGETDRNTVRFFYGSPILTNQELRFDLFSSEINQTGTSVALTPWAIPFAHFTDTIYRYTMVHYTPKDIVDDVSSAIFRKPSDFRKVYPIANDYKHLKFVLNTSDLWLYITPFKEREINILIPPKISKSILDLNNPKECVIVLGCSENGGCPERLSIDERDSLTIPIRLSETFYFKKIPNLSGEFIYPDANSSFFSDSVLIPIQLSPGIHTLNFYSDYVDGNISTTFTCRNEKIRYLLINTSVKENTFHGLTFDAGSITSSSDMPDVFKDRPLMIMYRGIWLLEPKY